MEETIVRRMDLREGEPYAWFPELNLVGVPRDLDEAGVQAALCKLSVDWRRSMLRVVGD